jgi:hypothetical protein
MFNKPCLGCGVLIRGASYCGPCQPPKRRTPQYLAKKRNLYGGTYKARAAQVRAESTHCYLCGQPFKEGEPIQADHLYPQLGSDSPLGAAHPVCNREKSNRPAQ